MFVVYSVKGTVTVVENKVETKAKSARSSMPIVRSKLQPVLLPLCFCNETKMFSLSKAGNYTTANLADSCKQIIVLLAPIT
jgi:hypothetical protein